MEQYLHPMQMMKSCLKPDKKKILLASYENCLSCLDVLLDEEHKHNSFFCTSSAGNQFTLYWRASVASETLTGVTQSKIGDVSLFIYLFICIYVWTYVRHFCTLTLAFLC